MEFIKKYNIDFQALKDANSELANPDLIMPGMKVKIPVNKKQVSQSQATAGPKEKLMKPYKQIPQKAQPVIKEDDQKPKQKIEKKLPFPKLPPMSINMPKLPNIHANQYNIDVDIDDHDTVIKSNQTIHPSHYPTQQKAVPEKKEPIKDKKMEIEKTEWSKQSMMMVPVMPCPMMFYPQYPNQQMPVQNLCQSYQDPAKLYENYSYQQPAWKAQEASPAAQNQWGEMDVNDQAQQGMTQQMNQSYYPQQWPVQYYGNQSYSYPYQYPSYGTQGYQNYATYAPRGESNEDYDED